jgi:hypothetical protein
MGIYFAIGFLLGLLELGANYEYDTPKENLVIFLKIMFLYPYYILKFIFGGN